MPRSDPTDTGGLFLGRRPGTAPAGHQPPPRHSARRRRADALLASVVLLLELLVVLSAWLLQPLAWIWVGSQLDYISGSVLLGIAVALAGLLATLLLTLVLATRIDELWRQLRRAAGHDQSDGALGRILVVTAVVASVAVTVWLLLIVGPGPSIAPR